MATHSHGRRGAEFTCEIHERYVGRARDVLTRGEWLGGPGESLLEAYESALAQIEALTPHSDPPDIRHGVPDEYALQQIEGLEAIVNSPFPADVAASVGASGFPDELHLSVSQLPRMILENDKRLRSFEND